MIRVVIDTSTVVSAAISPLGPNARVLALIANDEIRPYGQEIERRHKPAKILERF
jgi:predicted nucleic acid-binding protein